MITASVGLSVCRSHAKTGDGASARVETASPLHSLSVGAVSANSDQP